MIDTNAKSIDTQRFRNTSLTIRGGAVDIEPGYLHQEPADVQATLGGGEVQQVPTTGAADSPQVNLARHF